MITACCLCQASVAATAIPDELQARIKSKEGLSDAELNQLLPYIHPLVRQPVVGGLTLEVPAELGNQELARLGFADVTAAPFFADPQGKRDSTTAIQSAVNFARDHQMAAFFPPGIYLISDTIECVQNFSVRASGAISSPHHHACVLIGSSKNPAQRALLYLKPNAPGFRDETKKKVVVHILKRSFDKGFGNFDSGESYNQTFHNIDIRIGEGNRGAIAIRMQAAEGSSIQDCTIYNEYGHTGMRGAAGSGGGHHNLTIIAGKIGIDTRGWPPESPEHGTGTQPTPVMAHVTLLGQTEAALVHKSRGPLIGVGWRIQFPAAGSLIVNHKNHERAPFDSSMCLVDSMIEFENPSPTNTVLSTERSFYFHNVYVKNAARLTQDRPLDATSGEWRHFFHYACAVNPLPYRGYKFNEQPSIQGERIPAFVRVASAEPPADLCAHHIWPMNAPTWETQGAANVKRPPYNAAGDGVKDDSMAIQKAIDENEIVFLPKGYYCLSQTLQLKPNTKLVGVAHHLSILMTRSPFGTLYDPKNPKPLVETANTAHADTYIAFVGIGVPYHAEAGVAGETVGCYALRWQCGGTSILRSPGIHRLNIFGHGSGCPKDHRMLKFDSPLVFITGSGGGKWFNFFIHGGGYPETKDYRHIKLEGNTEPIRFYMLHAQHSSADSQCEAVGVKDMTVFGIKTENNTSSFHITDGDTVRLFGHGGIATPPAGGTHYLLRDVKNLLIACTSDQVNLDPSKAIKDGRIQRTNIRDYFPYVLMDGDQIQRLPSLERPVLFLKGNSFSGLDTKPLTKVGECERVLYEDNQSTACADVDTKVTNVLGTSVGMPLSSAASAFEVAAILHDEDALAGVHDVEVRDGIAYLGGKMGSLAIVDVRQPTAPRPLWSQRDVQAYDEAETVLLLDPGRLLVGTHDALLFDVTRLSQPELIASVKERPRVDLINGFARLGDTVVGANKLGCIFALDVSTPNTIKLVGSRETRESGELSSPHDAVFAGDLLVIVSPEGFGRGGGPGKLGVYRIADPTSRQVLPDQQWTLVGKIEHPRLAGANRVVTRGNFAYVASSLSQNIKRTDDLRSNVSVIDLSDPSIPRLCCSVDFPDARGPNGLEISGTMVFAAGGQTVQAIDVASPATPNELARLTATKVFPGAADDGHDLVYRDGYLFVTAQTSHSLVVVRVRDQRIREAASR